MHSGLIILLAGALGAGRARAPMRRPVSLVTVSQPDGFNLTVTPPTLIFNATNPATAPVVPGNSTTVVSWQVPSNGGKWSLRVKAASPKFANCATVPISAVTVSCASVSVLPAGGSASCSAPFALSTGESLVAGGSSGPAALLYSVAINFTLADSWKYIAETTPACMLSLTYKADVP
jgi:hypothetical protein